MTFDSVNGTIKGNPSQADKNYTVWFKRGSETATVTMRTHSLPNWAVGTFRGSVISMGYDWGDASSFEVTVSKTGTVAAKINSPIPGDGSFVIKTGALCIDGDNFSFAWDMEWGEYEWCSGEATISRLETDGVVVGVFAATEDGVDEDEDYFTATWHGYQDAYQAKPENLPVPVFGTDKSLYVPLDYDGGVTLNFETNGRVTVSEPGHAVVWASSNLLPISYDAGSGKVEASLWIMGCEEYWDEYSYGYEYETFGVELTLGISVDANGVAKASRVVVKSFSAGVNW